MISVHFQGKPFNITVLQVYAPTTNPKEDVGPHGTIQDLLELTQKKKKKVFFIKGEWYAKVGRQETPRVTGKLDLGVQNLGGQRLTDLPREHTGDSKHLLPTTQEMTLHMDITRWSIPKSD